MSHGAQIAALLIGSYVLGAVPFGLWVVYRLKGVDVRTLGSKNIGATNVARVAGPKVAAFVFALDVAKGLTPPLVGLWMGLASLWQILAALCAILGHNFSVFLGGKGGKGIATSLGALLGVAPYVGGAALTLFLLELLTLRWVSLGSILAALSLPVFSVAFYPGDHYRLGFCLAACVMAVAKHGANIKRLRDGTEPKITLFKKPSASASTDAGA